MPITLVIDIETVKNPIADAILAKRDYPAPKNIKDPVKIAAAIEAKKEKDKDRCGLRGDTGKVCSIAYQQVKDFEIHGETGCFYGTDERTILNDLGKLITALELGTHLHLSGYYSDKFDFRFLKLRYMASDLGLPQIFMERSKLHDVATIGSYVSMDEVISLDNACLMSGIPGKIGSGKEVQSWYDAGEWAKITDYNKDDALKTALLYCRLKPFGGVNLYQS